MSLMVHSNRSLVISISPGMHRQAFLRGTERGFTVRLGNWCWGFVLLISQFTIDLGIRGQCFQTLSFLLIVITLPSSCTPIS